MRAVCTVGFGDRYAALLPRLESAVRQYSPDSAFIVGTAGDHATRPYSFKPATLRSAGADVVLWLDSVMLPIAPMQPLWDRILRDGYYINGLDFTNYEWTADAAYPYLFPQLSLDEARTLNRAIPHLNAQVIGLDLGTAHGKQFLDQYYALSLTPAFSGPWRNDPVQGDSSTPYYSGPCGPADVRGHRHDQTAASVVAWSLGMLPSDGTGIIGDILVAKG